MTSNLYSNLPVAIPEELVEVLVDHRNVRIERIISTGHASPDGFWYDQDQHEWVLVLRGEAKLRFEGEESMHLQPGDCINIPAHKKHRVEWTACDEPTLWLAVFYQAE